MLLGLLGAGGIGGGYRRGTMLVVGVLGCRGPGPRLGLRGLRVGVLVPGMPGVWVGLPGGPQLGLAVLLLPPGQGSLLADDGVPRLLLPPGQGSLLVGDGVPRHLEGLLAGRVEGSQAGRRLLCPPLGIPERLPGIFFWGGGTVSGGG